MFAEPLTVFFADFAVPALYNGVTTVLVIFDAEYSEAFAREVEGRAPVAHVQTSALPAAAHGDTLVINGVTYTVRGVEPDGTGVTLLRLQAP
jgi:hypothetical protein